MYTPWANCLTPKAIYDQTITPKANSIFKFIHMGTIHASR